ncbi:hypothetical protein MMC29_002148, partial [Sticta canariensis]|nr:hypothetical protein [Sticta canariensis]
SCPKQAPKTEKILLKQKNKPIKSCQKKLQAPKKQETLSRKQALEPNTPINYLTTCLATYFTTCFSALLFRFQKTLNKSSGQNNRVTQDLEWLADQLRSAFSCRHTPKMRHPKALYAEVDSAQRTTKKLSRMRPSLRLQTGTPDRQ